MKNKVNYPTKSNFIPVNQEMLYGVRNELKDAIALSELKLSGRIDSIDQTLSSMNQRFSSVDQKFNSMDQKFSSIDQKFDSIDQKFNAVDRRFDSVDRRFDSVDRRFDSVENKIDNLSKEIKAMISIEMNKFLVLMEEQNSRNQYVLDGYTQIFDRQDKLDGRVTRLETQWMKPK